MRDRLWRDRSQVVQQEGTLNRRNRPRSRRVIRGNTHIFGAFCTLPLRVGVEISIQNMTQL